MPPVRIVLVCSVAVLVSGCASEIATPVTPATNNNSATAVAPGQGIAVSDASATQCSAGGKIYSVYFDDNHDGLRQAEEAVLSSQTVCNGTNGANGANGSNGHSLVYTSIVAPTAVCAAGGSTLLIASDVNDSGHYEATLPNQLSMTVCNGSNGTNGTDGHDAPTPAYAPVEAIQACGNSVAYKEVLLRLSNGQVLGSFSDNTSGQMTRLAFLPDGTYMNTDNSGCTFSLATAADTNMRSISWFGQQQLAWPIHY